MIAMSQNESMQQRALIKWASMQRIGIEDYRVSDFLYAIPNAAKRGPRLAAALKAEGLKAGVHDLHLPVPRPNFAGLWVEMKYGKNKMTDEQLGWKCKMELVGHKCVTCYTWEDAKDAIINYLGV